MAVGPDLALAVSGTGSRRSVAGEGLALTIALRKCGVLEDGDREEVST
jgi:hypothetical protein